MCLGTIFEETDADYVIPGMLDLGYLPEDVSQKAVEEDVIASIAEELNIQPKDVEIISIDMKTGIVIYKVSADNYEAFKDLQRKKDKSILQKVFTTLPGSMFLKKIFSVTFYY